MNGIDWNTITQIIAVTGFLISVYNLVSGIVSQRRNFAIQIYEIKSYADVTFLHIGIENKSRLSVSITQIILMCGGDKIPCTAGPTLLHSRTLRQGSEIIDSKKIFSSPMPLTVSGLSGQSAYILFENMQELPADESTFLTVEVCSNRGRPAKMKLELPADWASQRKVP